MILADKIIELRKKNGWSQEELAQKLDVSRQSISKWESAGSVPDMNKILKLSEVFQVSTDFLLKDEMEMPDRTDDAAAETESGAVRVSMEEASSFIAFRNTSSVRISFGVMLCIFSPILLIVLSSLAESGRISFSEYQATGIGICVMLFMIAAAVALFVMTGISGSRYEYLETSPIDTEYGVDGLVREKREKFRRVYTLQLTIGIVLCVIGAIPIFLAMILSYTSASILYTAAVAGVLFIIGIGVFLIVRCSIIWAGMNMLLEEGDYTRAGKEENRRMAPVASVYWCLAVAIYLAYSFITRRWDVSWIVWPIAGVLYGVVIGIMKVVHSRV